MIGRIATVREVKARWAYSEVNSPRFQVLYAHHPHSAAILSNANANVPFDDLSTMEVDVLVDLHRQVRAYFLPFLKDVGFFTCEVWSREQVESLHVSPGKRLLIPLRSFADSPPPVGLDGKPAWDDPRVAAGRVPRDRPFVQTEPVPVVQFEGRMVLLDGYCRSIVFLKSESKELLVWFSINSAEKT